MAARRHDTRNNVLLTAALTVSSMTLFWLIGYGVDPHAAAVLRTPLDDAVPFWPWSVYMYSWVYTSMLYPLFVIRCPALFRRTLLAYALVLAVCLASFALFPVTSLGLRPDVAALDTTTFHGWGTRLTFFVDPPTNLFPSQHLAIATLCVLAAWKARPLWGALALPIALGVGVSILTMKQHYIADGLAAVALAFAAWALVLRRYRPPAGTPRVAATWRGPAAYFAFHGLVYLALFVAFRAGWRPWA
jgi:membrane-associated phospholipid phosphatase